MAWEIIAWDWLVHSAVAGLIILGLGSAAVSICRQPVIRNRLILWTILGAVAVPWVGLLTVVPRWSVGLPRARAIETKIITSPLPVAGPGWARRTASIAPEPHDRAGAIGQSRDTVPRPTSGAGTSATEVAGSGMFSWRLTLVLAHFAISTALAAWWSIGQIVLFRLTSSARLVPQAVRNRFLQISGPEGECVRLLASDRIQSPLTFTWARPVILLPGSLCQSEDPEALRYSLAHEWSHVEQGDAWGWNLACLSGIVLFYQPLYWWLRRQLRLGQDYLADDRAAGCELRPEYAAFLVNLARPGTARAYRSAPGVSDRPSSLYRRIVSILEDRAPFQHRCRWTWSLPIAAVAVLVVVAAAGFRLKVQDEQKARPEQKSELFALPVVEVPPAKGPLNFHGRVTDKLTGKPLSGTSVKIEASVFLEQEGRFKALQENTHTTDAEGKYAFTVGPELVADSAVYLVVETRHAGYMKQDGNCGLDVILRNQSRGEKPFFEQIQLRPASAIEGRLLTPAGKPAAGVVVMACSTPQNADDNPTQEAKFTETRTDGQGRFKLDVFSSGKAVFWLLPEDYALTAHVLGEGHRGDLGSLTLENGINLRGKVLDADRKPVAGVHVSAVSESGMRGDNPDFPFGIADQRRRSVPTAADGTFVFGPLSPANYVVQLEQAWWDPPTHRAATPSSRAPLPGVFTPQKIRIQEGQEPPFMELQAVPQVVVEARYHDTEGNTRGGRRQTLWGFVKEELWSVQVEPDGAGKYVFLAPRGMERASLPIVPPFQANALQYRTSPNEPLMHAREIWLGTLDRDVKDIKIICYQAPTLFVKAADKNGRRVKGLTVSVDYTHPDFGPHGSPKVILKGGIQSDVVLEEQSDGRFRTMCLVPEREIVATVRADGFKPEARQMTLPAGETFELSLVLEPE